jgi:hypothetical protein
MRRELARHGGQLGSGSEWRSEVNPEYRLPVTTNATDFVINAGYQFLSGLHADRVSFAKGVVVQCEGNAGVHALVININIHRGDDGNEVFDHHVSSFTRDDLDAIMAAITAFEREKVAS